MKNKDLKNNQNRDVANSVTTELKKQLIPSYRSLLKDEFNIPIYPSTIQWGKNFPTEKNKGIIFVGKSVNGWITDNTQVDTLFDMNNPDRIFAREDQMEWVENLAGNKTGYNTKTSSFWRVIKQISQNYYPNEWSSYIAWSDLYKIAPEKGNPSEALKHKQLEDCIEILIKEINVLEPQYVVMLTSGWEQPFIEKLGINLNNQESINWDKYITKKYINMNNKIMYIISPHPQGKNENLHKETILKLMDSKL